MTKAQKVKEPLTFFNLPWYIFALVAVLVLGATYLGVLPTGMTGCFAFMIVLGTIFNWIGDHTPIIKSYLGGGAIVCIFGAGLLVYFHLIPDGTFALPLKENFDLVKGINSFFKGDGGFLDWYIAALITGSILGMNRKLLVKAAARYFPAIFGGLILAFGLCMGVAALMGYPVINALLLVALPIMGGGMGAGATPLSRIFDANPDVAMNAQQAISIMSPAVAIGNAISIVLAGILVKVMVGKLNGKGSLMQTGAMDASELDISPEMKQKREKISLADLGIGADLRWVLHRGLHSPGDLEFPGHRRHHSCLRLDDHHRCHLQDHQYRSGADRGSLLPVVPVHHEELHPHAAHRHRHLLSGYRHRHLLLQRHLSAAVPGHLHWRLPGRGPRRQAGGLLSL